MTGIIVSLLTVASSGTSRAAEPVPAHDPPSPAQSEARARFRGLGFGMFIHLAVTAKHHDGFGMFDSKQTDWDIAGRSPFRRDVMKALEGDSLELADVPTDPTDAIIVLEVPNAPQ